MGVLDMLNLVIFCMSDGVLSMIGAVYCSAPNFLYIKGALVLGTVNASLSLKYVSADEPKNERSDSSDEIPMWFLYTADCHNIYYGR